MSFRPISRIVTSKPTVEGAGVKLRRAIIDRFNIIEAGESVGFHRDQDERRQYHVDPSGIVVRARGTTRWG